MLSATDRFEIHQLKARYCRFLDSRQWLSLRALFTDDARFDGLGSAPDPGWLGSLSAPAP